MTLAKLAQCFDIVRGIFARLDHEFHLAAMHDQKEQEIDGTMAAVIFKIVVT